MDKGSKRVFLQMKKGKRKLKENTKRYGLKKLK